MLHKQSAGSNQRWRRLIACGPEQPGVLFGVAVLVGLALLVTGCERMRPPSDTLVVAQVAEPRSLDPQVTTALNDFRILVNLFEGLVRYQPGTLEPAPALAESWQISDDGRVYTFKLKDGVRFHDGSRFDAEAVRFNFQRMLDPEHPYHDTGPFPLAFFFETVASIEVLDRLTVRFRLDQPFAPFLSNLAYPAGLIVSPTAVKRWGDQVGRHPSGTGPFRFVDWRPGERVRLERFAADHLASNRSLREEQAQPLAGLQCDSGRASVRTLIFRPITDPMTRVAELLAGGVDLALELSPDNVARFRERDGFQVLEATGPHLWFLILNTREGPLSDVRVRRAVNLAIDRQVITDDVLRKTAVPAAGPVPEAFDWANNPELRPYRQDRPAARRLLAEAGYENGLRLRFLVPRGGSGMLDPLAMATAIQGDLGRIGVDAEIRSFEWNAYLARVNQGLDTEADMAEMAWMTNDPDTLPYLALRCDASPEQGGFNSGYYCSRRVDALIAQARRATDRDERARLYHQLEREVHQDVPWAVIASWRQNLVASAEVSGLQLEPSFYLRLGAVTKQGCASGTDSQ
ncbi:ABC transporter substrate-binding protein [Halochromatium roseum]|uniref:ABC transporter substrate-binding protein n=1 Tax=Halochromatium roseum TaxID=391920 RepID=UPI00191329FF|nr:ABC transporter substrate-binding protein [Halochromatium roseum]